MTDVNDRAVHRAFLSALNDSGRPYLVVGEAAASVLAKRQEISKLEIWLGPSKTKEKSESTVHSWKNLGSSDRPLPKNSEDAFAYYKELLRREAENKQTQSADDSTAALWISFHRKLKEGVEERGDIDAEKQPIFFKIAERIARKQIWLHEEDTLHGLKFLLADEMRCTHEFADEHFVRFISGDHLIMQRHYMANSPERFVQVKILEQQVRETAAQRELLLRLKSPLH